MGKLFHGVIRVTEGVDGRNSVSDIDKGVSVEIFIGLFTWFGSYRENVWVIQSGSLWVDVG